MPASPQPGGYHVQRISVDDPNLGRVEREFSISLPTRYYDRSFSTNNYSIISLKYSINRLKRYRITREIG